MNASTGSTTQVYRVYIKAAPQAIWDAITNPDWTEKYGYGGRAEFKPDVRAGASYRIMSAAGRLNAMPSSSPHGAWSFSDNGATFIR